jgi:hypothetical protein
MPERVVADDHGMDFRELTERFRFWHGRHRDSFLAWYMLPVALAIGAALATAMN